MAKDQRPRARDTETPGEERQRSTPHGVGPGNRTTKRFDEAPDAATDPQAAFDASVRAVEEAVHVGNDHEPVGTDVGGAKDPCPRCGGPLERLITVGGWSGLPVEGAKCAACGYVAEPRYLSDTAKLGG